jgi:hypothetical protein
MLEVKPQAEHAWLKQLVGNWTYEFECLMGPDQPPSKSTGKLVGRALGDVWVAMESQTEAPGGGTAQNVMTLGFDPVQGRFVGSFISSMMTYHWVYNGQLDATGKVLKLDTVGPKFTEPQLVEYQDILTIVDENHFILSSQMKGENGEWTQFMTGHHRRAQS